MNKSILILLIISALKTEAQTSVLNVADSLYLHGNYTKSIESYQLYDKPEDVYDKIAKAYVALGNFDEALDNYTKGLEANPQDALLKFDYAKLLSRAKKYSESSKLFNELIYLDSTNPNYHYELGMVLEQTNDSTAMNQFQKTYYLDATHQRAIYKIAKYLLTKGQYDRSLSYINKGLESYTNNVELINLKAQNYYWSEDYREAAKWFEKLIALGESSQFIHEKLGFCYARHFEYNKAIEQGLIALKFDPKNTTNLYILGQLYEQSQDFPNAEKYLTATLVIMDQPLDEEYKKLGYVLNRQGKHKEAIEALQKSLKENPGDELTLFYMLMAKDKYYEDVETRLKLYEDFKAKYPESGFDYMVDRRIKELKEEKFMKAED